MGKRLSDLTFSQWLSESTIRISPFNLLSISLKSSSLTKLQTDVNDFNECLYLLDGRLECNIEPQQNKQQQSSTFGHLFELDLHLAHIDYVIQFLFDRKLFLPCLANLYIEYQPLVIVTNHFTNDATHLNCAKIEKLFINESFV
ncbi:unnamed protein product [Rotaria sordida]|nr:unnamed protein product [Rotaria sordida]